VREKSPGVCELEMEMFMAPAIYVPFGIRQMVGGQVRRQLRGVLSNLQQRLAERAAAGGGGAAALARAAAPGQLRGGLGGWQQPWLAPWAPLDGKGGAAAGAACPQRQRHLQLERELRQQPPWWSMPCDIVAAA
jgi:hypothetical protein